MPQAPQISAMTSCRGSTTGREIAYNYVTNSCLSLADGAGIYTGGRSESSEYDRYHHNIVTDVLGYLGGSAEDGQSCPEPAGLCWGGGCGIYLDEHGNHRIFEHNTTVDCGWAGIYLHWTQENRLDRNTMYGNAYYQLLLSGKNEIDSILRENDVQENLLIATEPNQKTLQIENEYEDVDFGDSDNNYFYHPDGGKHIAVQQNLVHKDRYTVYTLAEWTALSGKDANSTDLSPGIVPDTDLATPICLINPSVEPLEVDLAEQEYRDLYGDVVKGTVSVGPFGSVVLFPPASGDH